MAAIVLFVTLTFFSWLLPLLPGLVDGNEFSSGLCAARQPCEFHWVEPSVGYSDPSFWVSLLLASLTFLLVSGALSKARRSPGMTVASTYPVLAKSVGTSDCTPPGRLRMAGRWAVVLALFAGGSYVGGSGVWGILLVVAAWAPSLFGSKRALHDVLTGTAVVERGFEDRPEPASTAIS